MEGKTFFDSAVVGHTTLHPVGVAVLICLLIGLFWLPRKHATWPIVISTSLIACGQRVMVGSVNFPFLRILLVAAFFRILFRAEYRGIRLHKIDFFTLAFFFTKFVVFNLYYKDFTAFVYILGIVSEPLCCYLFFRCLIRNWTDFQSMVLAYACCSLPVAVAFVIENSNGRNVFAFLGGVPEMTEVRAGRVRCQGPYSHAILAGCYWAALIPIIAARWFSPGLSKIMTILATLSSVLCVILSASSTPLMALIFVFIGAAVFVFRRDMMKVRWAIVAVMLALQFTMKGNIWSLIARANVVGGSTGWHRTHLMEQAYQHFSEWCFFGTSSTEHWGWGLRDVTNQYLLEGVRGGFLTMVLFILSIAYSFKHIGRLNKEAISDGDFPNLANSWALGIMLFVHVTSFFATSYFGQIICSYWMTIAVAASLTNGPWGNSTIDHDHLIYGGDYSLLDTHQSDSNSEDAQSRFDRHEDEDEDAFEYEDEYEYEQEEGIR